MIHEMRDGRRLAMSLLAIAALFAIVSFVSPHAQAPYDVKANYVKREVSIPMRDGVKLFTIIYSPKATTERYPMLMTRTAYGIGPYGPDSYRTVLGPYNEFAKEGYVFVYQDTRGKFKSEGEFVHHVPIVK
jgi:predicted acyl esterase